MKNRTVPFILLSCIILFISGIAYGSELEGRMVFNYYKIILLETKAGEKEVVLLKDGTGFKNFTAKGELKAWENLKIRYTDEVSGVKIADEIEIAPALEIDPSSDMSLEEVSNLIDTGKGYLLIDTRHFEEYEAGHLPTAISMPYDMFDANRLPKEKNKLIVFYSEDNRDPSAYESMKKALALKYKKVKVFSDGLRGWTHTNKHTVSGIGYLKRQIAEGRPIVIVDTRHREKVKTGFIPGAVSIPLEEMIDRKVLGSWVPEPIVFYGEDSLDRRAFKTAEIAANLGYSGQGDIPVNVLDGGFKAWKAKGQEVAKGDILTSVNILPLPQGIISIEEFRQIWKEKSKDRVLLDVRGDAPELLKDFVTGIGIDELAFRISELPKDKEIIVFCAFGYRAKVAYYILKNNGYRVRYLNRNPAINLDGTLTK